MDSHHQPPGSEPGAPLLSYGAIEMNPPTGVAPVFAAPAAMQMALRGWKATLPRNAFADTSGVRRCQRFGGM